MCVFGPKASPGSPSSAAPCDDCQELPGCAGLYLARVTAHGRGRVSELGAKGEESRDRDVALLNNVWDSQTQMG